MYTVYKITNLINTKSYIGSSIRVEQRWREHINSAFNSNSHSYNYPLQAAIRKYGKENFSFEILCNTYNSVEEMQYGEQEFIIKFDTVKNGYNQTYKTNQISILEESRIKYVDSIKQKCAKVDSQENIIEIYSSYQEASRLNGNKNCASHIRAVCKGELSSYCGEYYRDLDENNKIIPKPFKSYKGRKPIVGISIDNPLEEVYFESILKASKELNLSRQSIEKCLAGQTRYSKVGGYIWRFIDEQGIIENCLPVQQVIEEYNETNPLINGERHTITEWCKIYNITKTCYYYRRNQGKSIIEALTEPKRR